MSTSTSIDLNSLPPVENLFATRAQIEKDLNLLSDSFNQLKAAAQNFSTSIKLLEKPLEGEALVPLTSSVYVPAILQDSNRVMIDVGTGYYIEQPVNDAKEYFKGKVSFITGQLDSLTPVLQEKKSMMGVLSQVITQKMKQQQQQ